MKRNARAIVIKDGNLLLMKRFKVDKEYYTLLGGGVNNDEQPEDAAIRETMEESGVSIKSPRLMYVEEAGEPFGDQYIYFCDYVSGDPKLPDDSEEAYWSIPGKNTYEPVWFPFSKLQEIPFVSPLLREALVLARDKGFPNEPFHFSSKHADRLSL